MAKTITDQPKQIDTDQAMTYSIKEAAKKLKRSESSVKNYKRVLLEAWNSKDFEVIADNGSLTEKGLSELREIMKYAKQGNPDQYISVLWATNPELSNEKDSGDRIGYGNDQGIGYGNLGVRPSEINLTVREESEIDVTGEVSETLAMQRFDATKELSLQMAQAFQEIYDVRHGFKEFFKHQVTSGAYEGISEGLAEVGKVSQGVNPLGKS